MLLTKCVTYYAEEVQLPRGEQASALTSSTGRRLRVTSSTSNSNNNNGGRGSSIRGRAGDAMTVASVATTTTTARARALRRATTAPSLHASELTCVDMYGFRVTLREKAAEDAQRRGERASEQRRLARWRALLRYWRATRSDLATRKRLCRDGIPHALRATAWRWLLGTLIAVDGGGGGGGSSSDVNGGSAPAMVYAHLCATPPDDELAAVIDRDLARTFPTHRLFDNDDDGSNSNGSNDNSNSSDKGSGGSSSKSGGGSVGQAMLRRVLRAYAVRNVEVGYVQGMSFLAATLLVQLENELDAFWALCALMEHPPYQLQRLYLPGFPQLHCACYVLERLLRRVHRALYARLRRAEVATSVYATQWFLTLFAYNLNFGLLARIWDMFLCEGWKPIYRVALAFLVRGARDVLALRNDGDCIVALRALQDEQDMAAVLRTAQDIDFTTAQMYRYERRYWRLVQRQQQQQQQHGKLSRKAA